MAASTKRVPIEEREGVFVHAFKCQLCGLEFQLYSWKKDRHHVGSVFCPECGEQTPMLHLRTCVNESRELGRLDDEREIYRMTTRYPGFILMDDSAVG
jgi:hypothetical protein